MIVLDASVVLCWALGDEEDQNADEAMRLASRDGAWVPGIWRYELMNALLVSERRGRLEARDVVEILADVRNLPVAADHKATDETVVALARRHALSAYDAAYLEVAKRRDLPLASLDRRLQAGAVAAGVALVVAPRS